VSLKCIIKERKEIMLEQIKSYDLILAIILFFSGFIVDIVARIGHTWYYSPKLTIESDIPLQNQEIRVGMGSSSNGERRDVNYHSIKIKNDGRTSAENCKGLIFLNGIDQEDIISNPIYDQAMIYKLTSRGISGAVCWACGGNPQYITINSKDDELLDIYKVIIKNSNFEQIVIPSEKGWEKPRVFLKAKEYNGKLKITAANVKPVEKSFKLKIEETDVKIYFY
jgi:hypothetical protein